MQSVEPKNRILCKTFRVRQSSGKSGYSQFAIGAWCFLSYEPKYFSTKSTEETMNSFPRR